MTTHAFINPPTLPPPVGYSHAAVASGRNVVTALEAAGAEPDPPNSTQ